MRILQVTTAIGWSGGTEQCFLLAKYMNDFGYETDILTFEGCELDERAKKIGIKTVYFPNTKKLSLQETKKLAQIIEKYDVVNTHISRAHWFIWLASFFTKKKPKIVYTRRVPFPISKISLFTKYNINTDAIIAVSPQIFESLKSLPFIRNKLYYIPSGVELNRFSPKIESSIRKELGISEDAIVFTNVGNFSDVKGQHILIPAFQKFVENFKDIEVYLLLAGRDTQSEKALSMIRNYGVENKVYPLGFRRDIPQILKATDIFVFPSLNEGIAGSLLQAMAMKKVVVASYVGGIKSYLKHMENGIAVEPGSVDSLYQGLLEGLKNLKNENMKENARKTALDFDIKKITQKTLQLYKELLK
ncbi:glycosyltransferase family 4 protein [Desulfurobacterium thermolithotrophum]|uniref:glycosyltransferase family 4 protein n=1 Tax=Desulfurobacterium thermolithotrophum TaxID=64160 RepID=UPI0013D4CB1A|nr:glycosyltransferase family 4 protein [Desulfurobacterium thermolithotrophum]